MPDAESQWYALASTYSSNQELLRKLWQELQQHYTSRGRHYHTLQHIEVLLLLAEEHEALIQQADALRFAIFYHDIIYITTRSDNEAKCAALAAKRLQELHVMEEAIHTVQELISATKSHQLHPQPDVNLMLDFGLSILGADWERYSAYSQQIRREYGHFPDLLYKSGRKRVLQHFLALPSIYKTATFQERLEAQARQNLQRELQAL